MTVPLGITLMLLLNLTYGSSLVGGASHPAIVGENADSVAKQLHYPAKERAAGKQGIVKFYCEITPQGKPVHISTLAGKKEERFATAVEYALRHGRFTPATMNGQPTSVMIGGTVLFMSVNGRPTIAVTLTTAETEKIAKIANYVQPQMLDSDELFRRRLFAMRDKYPLHPGVHSGAVVVVHVDAQGKVAGKKLVTESPPNGGHGQLLLDVVDQEKFIPAQSSGQPVAGDFELAVDFEHMRNPDSGARIGTLIKDRDDQ